MTDMFGPDDPEGPPDLWENFWSGGGGEPPDWWNEDVTVWSFDEQGFTPYTYTGEDWFNEAFNSNEENLALYGLDTLDIIHQLEDMGLWGEEEWDYWRENYE